MIPSHDGFKIRPVWRPALRKPKYERLALPPSYAFLLSRTMAASEQALAWVREWGGTLFEVDERE